MYRINCIAIAFTLLPLLLTGCSLTGSRQSGCRTCRTDSPDDAGTAILDESFVREMADAKARNTQLAMELTDVRSERDSLWDRVARLEKEREITLTSVTNANQQVGVTRSELDRAAQEIQTVRGQLQHLIDEVSSLDAAHASQIDRFSQRLNGLVNEYDAVAGPALSQPLDQQPRLPQYGR